MLRGWKVGSETGQRVFLRALAKNKKQELCSEHTNQLQSICNCPGITERGGRANLEKTGPNKNNRVELDQRNPPGVCPFVGSILGRAEAASNSKGQSGAWGKWSFPASCGKGGVAAVLLPGCWKLVIHHQRARPLLTSAAFSYQKQRFRARLHSQG